MRKSYFLTHFENLDTKNLNVLIISFYLLSIFYLYMAVKTAVSTTPRYLLMKFLLPLLIVLSITPPLFSIDFASYLISAKNMVLYGPQSFFQPLNYQDSNPWVNKITAWWVAFPPAYGPLFVILMSPLTIISDNMLVSLFL
ncbi:MAG: hypothetical protein AAB443_00615 [Patescibacteria group bacterium]